MVAAITDDQLIDGVLDVLTTGPHDGDQADAVMQTFLDKLFELADRT